MGDGNNGSNDGSRGNGDDDNDSGGGGDNAHVNYKTKITKLTQHTEKKKK